MNKLIAALVAIASLAIGLIAAWVSGKRHGESKVSKEVEDEREAERKRIDAVYDSYMRNVNAIMRKYPPGGDRIKALYKLHQFYKKSDKL